MSKITVTMEFDNVDAMLAHFEGGPALSPAAAAAAPAAVLAEPPAVSASAPAAAAPAPAPQPAAAPAAAPAAEPAATVDYSALRAQLTERLKTTAQRLGTDAVKLGQFITTFGVQRFSQLGDDRLQEFVQKLDVEFPES